jgi:hypothetical protein
MKSIGGRSKVKEVSDDKGRLSNFIEVSRGKVLLLVRTAVLTPLPPGEIIKLQVFHHSLPKNNRGKDF